MTLKEMCRSITPYVCNECGNDTLFFITKNGILIDYKTMMERGMSLTQIKQFLYEKNIKYIKCISCNRQYIIDWRNGYPVNLIDRQALLDFGL